MTEGSETERQVPPALVSRIREVNRLDSAVYERSDLFPGCSFHGPAIIEEAAASTVVPPGVTGTVDAIGNIILTIGEAA